MVTGLTSLFWQIVCAISAILSATRLIALVLVSLFIGGDSISSVFLLLKLLFKFTLVAHVMKLTFNKELITPCFHAKEAMVVLPFRIVNI